MSLNRLPLIGNQVPETDAEIVSLARAGDSRGLSVLYERYAGGLLRVGERLLGSRADAEDLLHDLFVGLPELLGRYEHRGQLDAWLRSVTIKLALGQLRRDRNRDRVAELHEASLDREPTSSDPWSALDLERSIARLSVGERAVFTLRYLEGLPHEETALRLGISPGAVRVRFARALQHLQELLEPVR